MNKITPMSEKASAPSITPPAVKVSLPYVLRVTGASPVCIFGKKDNPERITVLSGKNGNLESYDDLKARFEKEQYATIGMIRIQCAESVDMEVAIAFRREINGTVVTKKFFAPFFMQSNQLIWSIFDLEMNDFPLDGKTEILLAGSETTQIYLYPVAIYATKGDLSILHHETDRDAMFLAAINSGRFYDDCIEIFNPTNEAQSMEITLNENGVECDNKSLVVSNAGVKYQPDDIVYLHKVFSKGEKYPSVLTVIAKDAFRVVPLVRAKNAYTNQVSTIRQRIALEAGKKIGALCDPLSSWCLFVNVNKRPIYNIESSIYWNFEQVDFNSAGEVRELISKLDQQKEYLNGLLEKNEFPL